MFEQEVIVVLLAHCLSFCSRQDLISCGKVNVRWKKCASSVIAWKSIYYALVASVLDESFFHVQSSDDCLYLDTQIQIFIEAMRRQTGKTKSNVLLTGKTGAKEAQQLNEQKKQMFHDKYVALVDFLSATVYWFDRKDRFEAIVTDALLIFEGPFFLIMQCTSLWIFLLLTFTSCLQNECFPLKNFIPIFVIAFSAMLLAFLILFMEEGRCLRFAYRRFIDKGQGPLAPHMFRFSHLGLWTHSVGTLLASLFIVFTSLRFASVVEWHYLIVFSPLFIYITSVMLYDSQFLCGDCQRAMDTVMGMLFFVCPVLVCVFLWALKLQYQLNNVYFYQACLPLLGFIGMYERVCRHFNGMTIHNSVQFCATGTLVGATCLWFLIALCYYLDSGHYFQTDQVPDALTGHDYVMIFVPLFVLMCYITTAFAVRVHQIWRNGQDILVECPAVRRKRIGEICIATLTDGSISK